MDEDELLRAIGYDHREWADEGNGFGPKTAQAVLDRFAYLGDRPTLEELFAFFEEAKPPVGRLERQWLRERLIAALRGKVSAPASVVDAWLGLPEGRKEELQGTAVELPDPDPWPDPVAGADLLSEIEALFSRFVVLTEAARAALALWTIHAHALDAFGISPLLVITSPTKRCGKTNAMRVLALVVPRPLLSSNVSPAALFRTVERFRPTLLMDEADTFVRLSEEHRGLLNAGHTRDAALVIRTVGDDHEPRLFSTWCPKVVAAIGRLPGTIEDRAVVVSLRRRTADEPVERLRPERVRDQAEAARRRARRWVADHLGPLKAADPRPVPGLNDRAQDNWMPLLAVADVAGGDWPARARSAALELSGGIEEDTAGILLLEDLAAVFAERGVDRLPTQEILGALHRIEERPWADWKRGRPLSAEQLARLLRDFGVHPKPFPKGKVRGYRLEDGLAEAFRRYLPQHPGPHPSPRHPQDTYAGQGSLSWPAEPVTLPAGGDGGSEGSDVR